VTGLGEDERHVVEHVDLHERRGLHHGVDESHAHAVAVGLERQLHDREVERSLLHRASPATQQEDSAVGRGHVVDTHRTRDGGDRLDRREHRGGLADVARGSSDGLLTPERVLHVVAQRPVVHHHPVEDVITVGLRLALSAKAVEQGRGNALPAAATAPWFVDCRIKVDGSPAGCGSIGMPREPGMTWAGVSWLRHASTK